MNDRENIKFAVVAGASHALKYKDKNPRTTDEDIIQNVIDNIDTIIKKIEEQDSLGL